MPWRASEGIEEKGARTIPSWPRARYALLDEKARVAK